MNTLKLLVLSLFLFSTQAIKAQIEFTGLAYEAALLKAKEENKLIFVDIYTNWCGPCKKLSKTTFQDKKIGQDMNASFINMKWDAESKDYRAICKELGVKSYPTLLFIQPNGEVFSRLNGFHDVKTFNKKTNAVKTIWADKTLTKKLKNPDKLSLEESNAILNKYKDLKTPILSSLYQQFRKKVGDDPNLKIKYLHTIIPYITKNESLEHLRFYANNLNENKDIKRMNYKDKIEVTYDILQVLKEKSNQAIKDAEFDLMLSCETLLLEIDPINAFVMNKSEKSEKQLKSRKLDYYAYNKMKDKYDPLADSMVNQYILPFSPTSSLAKDKIMAKMAKKIFKNMDKYGADAKSPEPSPRDSLMSAHLNSLPLATNLNQVTSTYSKLYEDPSILEKALEWSSLAYEYLPLPEYQVTKAQLLSKLNRKKEAIAILDLAEKSIYSDQNLKKKIKKIRAEIN